MTWISGQGMQALLWWLEACEPADDFVTLGEFGIGAGRLHVERMWADCQRGDWLLGWCAGVGVNLRLVFRVAVMLGARRGRLEELCYWHAQAHQVADEVYAGCRGNEEELAGCAQVVRSTIPFDVMWKATGSMLKLAKPLYLADKVAIARDDAYWRRNGGGYPG